MGIHGLIFNSTDNLGPGLAIVILIWMIVTVSVIFGSPFDACLRFQFQYVIARQREPMPACLVPNQLPLILEVPHRDRRPDGLLFLFLFVISVVAFLGGGVVVLRLIFTGNFIAFRLLGGN